MRRSCYVVDTFTSEPLAGNPAGVLLDGAGLDDAVMRRIASELKHSETAFPLPGRDSDASLHLRWFTPSSEVAFCGHGTLAALHVLVEEAGRIRVPEGKVTRTAFTCRSGRLQVELSRDHGALRIWIETPESRFESVQVPADAVTALGLVPEALDPERPPRRSLVLEGNLFLAARDRSALARCRPDAEALAAVARRLGVSGFVVYAVAPGGGIDAAMRCFFPGDGIVEDPVTGSAAGQLGVLLHQTLPEERKLLFSQGDEMGRPGRVEVEIRPDRESGTPRGWIGGDAVTVLRGELSL
jgi:PhzF family phenazine biosynthesis protein